MSKENYIRILITGGEGFLGKRLSVHFNRLNIETFSYDIVNNQEINDYELLKKCCSDFKISMIIHLAAIADLNIMAQNEEMGNRINIEGTCTVLKICNELEIRMLFASTCCIYGNNDCHPSDEESITCPTECYAKSKKMGESFILNSDKSLGHTILRLATFFGPAMRKELAPAIFISKIYNEDIVEIHGDGKQSRTMTYVDDIVSGISCVALSKYKYPIINVTTNESVSVLDMVRIAEEVVGKKSTVKHIDDRPGQILHEEILNTKLSSLGWEPKFSFYDGMKKSYEFFSQNNFKF